MKKLVSLIILIPVGLVLIVLAVANRQDVSLSLDPFNADGGQLSLTLPFYLFLFAALICGMILGGAATWWSQGRFRKSSRRSQAEANRLKQDIEKLQQQLGKETPRTASGLPILTDRNAA